MNNSLTSACRMLLWRGLEHVTRACHMLSQSARVTCYPRVRVSHVIPPGRACHMLPQGARVTCYPFALLCFSLLCFALPGLGNLLIWLRNLLIWLRNLFISCVTYYFRPRVSHVIPGCACHMLSLCSDLLFFALLCFAWAWKSLYPVSYTHLRAHET